MEPLNITITDLGLDTVIDGDYEHGGRTLADAIVDRAVTALTKDQEYREVHGGLAKRVSQIRDEEIRERVRVEIKKVMAQPIHATNQWGERTSGETTLLALIVAQAEKFFTEKRTKDSYDRSPAMTGAQRVIAEMVQASLTKELAAIFAEEKAKVVKAVQGKAAELIAQAVKDGLR